MAFVIDPTLIMEVMIIPLFSLMAWLIRSQQKSNERLTASNERLASSIDGLAMNVAYCPTRKKIEQNIKG